MTPGENRGRLAGLRGEACVTGLQRAGNRRAARGALVTGRLLVPGEQGCAFHWSLQEQDRTHPAGTRRPAASQALRRPTARQTGRRAHRGAGPVSRAPSLSAAALSSAHSVTGHQAPLCSAESFSCWACFSPFCPDRGRSGPGRGVSTSLVLPRNASPDDERQVGFRAWTPSPGRGLRP